MQSRWLRVVPVAGLVLSALIARPAVAQHVGIGVDVNIPTAQFNLQIGPRPALVAVPGVPVYYAPHVGGNYFVYGSHYYVFHGGWWFASSYHNGPWMRLAMHQVPRPVLAVPVTYYKVRPAHWKKTGPPPWAHQDRGHDRHGRGDWDRDDRGRDRGHDDHGRKHGKGH